jgi:hypothetical protein
MPARGWRRYVRRRILVTTIDRAVFVGILWDGRGPIVLRDARLVAEAGAALASPTPLDGEVIIDFDRVAWVQAPPASD